MNNHQSWIINFRKSLFVTLSLLGLLLIFCDVGQAQTKEELKMLIRVDSQMFMSGYRDYNHGYIVYRGKIHNLDEKHSHQIVFKQGTTLLKSFELNPGESVNVSLPIPVTSYSSSPINYSIDNQTKEIISLHAYSSSSSSDFSCVCLACRSLRKDFSGAGADCIYAEQDCKFWPHDRLDYSCLDMIFLTPDELTQAPESVQNALRQFVQAGGELVLFDCKEQHESVEKIAWINHIQKETLPELLSQPTNEWQQENILDDVKDSTQTEKSEDSVPENYSIDNEDSIEPKIKRFKHVFGKVYLIDCSVGDFQSTVLNCLDEEILQRTLEVLKTRPSSENWYTMSIVWSPHPGIVKPWQDLFPVVEDFGIPQFEISIVIIVFVLLAGPINLMILNKKNKRIWLLVTVPALSFVFAGAILTYTTVHEGFQTEVRISNVAYLDQQEGSFVSLSQLGMYARTRAKGVSFEPNDELNYLGDGKGHGEARLNVNWTTGMQQLDSNFAPVRTPVYYKIRKTGTTRLKLDFDFKASNPYVVNGLGKDINTIYICDENGLLWTATNIPAGQKVTLKCIAENLDGYIQKVDGTDIVSTELSKMMHKQNWDMTSLPFTLDNKDLTKTLPANTYAVTFDSPGPFANKGISYAKEKNCFSLILGKY